MTTLWETQTLDSLQAEEARRHNEQIRQKYLQLQNAEEAQLSHVFENAEQQTRAEEFNAPAAPVSAMPAAPVAPAQTAQAKTVSLTEQQKDLFTADTFRRMVSGAAKAQAPVQAPVQESVQAPVYRPVFTPAPEKTQEAVKQAEKSIESYSLTNCGEGGDRGSGGVRCVADYADRHKHPHFERERRRAFRAGSKKSRACRAKQRTRRTHRKRHERRNDRRVGASKRLGEVV